VITVQAKVAGGRRPLVPEFELPPFDGAAEAGSPPTLRDVISRVVRQEVELFRERQEQNQFLRALTSKQIEEGVSRGAVRSGGTEVTVSELDADVAVGTALQAFEDGLYLVLIDREQCESLDEQVVVGADSTVTFLRLVALAGG
jgi:hypothetical protein